MALHKVSPRRMPGPNLNWVVFFAKNLGPGMRRGDIGIVVSQGTNSLYLASEAI